ncbi:lipid-A-disaccharide synthase N-terminal domain-containing protein [Aureimonas sp. AU4]|uniref:lipid-A-disaccharide synthase N-terminal domain-containing protein n=1 Tax=Aureimonas sp. AU4 TaxID=1638163 RepID=UPI0007859A3F|nr:lipid-A-disaccharide synthase N-terminal domain-containing protein [Aureimonas sp. AU4]
MSGETAWLVLGFAGQSLFFTRFLVQWIVSERRRESVLPRAFWFFSLGGGVLLLAYALHRGDIVFMSGQAVGLVVYLRNIALSRRPAPAAAVAPSAP